MIGMIWIWIEDLSSNSLSEAESSVGCFLELGGVWHQNRRSWNVLSVGQNKMRLAYTTSYVLLTLTMTLYATSV